MTTLSKNTALIHGYGLDHRTWYPVELAFEGHHVIYLPLPGFDAEPVTRSYTIKELANENWSRLDEVGAENVNLVGHSMGGYVCLEMLALQPSRVSSLSLVHSHVYADSAEKKAARTATLNDIESNGTSGFINQFYTKLFANAKNTDPLIKMLIRRGHQYDDNAWYYGMQAMRDRRDHSDTVKTAGIPVLLLMGALDNAVPVELALKQSVLAERASFHLYESIGHMGMYENTQQVIRDLIRFYEEFEL